MALEHGGGRGDPLHAMCEGCAAPAVLLLRTMHGTHRPMRALTHRDGGRTLAMGRQGRIPLPEGLLLLLLLLVLVLLLRRRRRLPVLLLLLLLLLLALLLLLVERHVLAQLRGEGGRGRVKGEGGRLCAGGSR